MTQIFLNQGLGLSGSSLGQLGGYGPKGQAGLGQGGESIYINAANGNLVLRQSDGFLAGSGLGLELIQSYNSLGEKGQNWCFNIQTHLIINGTANSPDSSVTRIDEDGHRSRFIFDAAKGYYVAENGGTAKLSFSNNQWSYQEGSSATRCEYNENGLLTRLIDKDGHQLLFHYRDGLLEKISDNSGKQSIEWIFEKGKLCDIRTLSEGKIVHHLHFDYDENQRLQKVSRDLGDGTIYWITYDYLGDSNQITTIRQSDGSVLDIAYDSEGRVTQLKDGEGHTTSYQYLSGKTLVTDNLGQTTTYYYDEKGRLTGIDSPTHASVRYEYKGNYLAAIHQGNLHWFFSYNEAGDCIRIEEPSGQVKTRIFDSEHRLLKETSSTIFNGSQHPDQPKVSHYVYDENGHLRFKITADGSVTEYRYNQEGQCLSIRTYLHATYNLNQLTEEQTPDLKDLLSWVNVQNPQKISLKTYHYDWRGLMDEEAIYSEIDAQGEGIIKKAIQSRYHHDAAGRLVEKSLQTEKGLNTTTYLYDDLGRLIQRCDSQMHSERFEYDDANQRMIETDANGLQRIHHFDRNGLELTTQYLDNHQRDLGTIHYNYDALGRLQSEISADAKATYYFYDAEGQLIAKCLPGGKLTQYRYDGLGRLLQTIQHQETVNTKDWQKSMPEWSSLDLKANARDRISQIIYNDLNQIAYQIDAGGAVIAFTYNTDGQVIKKTAYTKRLNDFQPTKIYSFTEINLEPSSADRSNYYFYDSVGRLQAEVNGEGGATAYHYDREGHLLETIRYAKRLKLPPPTDWGAPELSREDIHSFSFYNAAGLKIADIDPQGFVTTYEYNEAGLLTQKRSFSTALDPKLFAKINSETTLAFLLLQEKTSDHLSNYRYDSLGQLIEQREQNGLVTGYRYDAKGAILEKKLIDEKTKAQRQERYRYDAMGRVIQSLDALGAAKLEQNDSLSEDEIETIWQQHSLQFSYDLAGRLISRTNSLNQTTRYFYNESGQLLYTLNANGEVTELHYNAFNQIELTYRYSKKIQGDLASLTQKELAQQLINLKNEKVDEFTRYEYNNLGLLVKKETGSKGNLTLNYNSFGELEETNERIDATHQRLNRFSYDRRGLLNHRTDDVGGFNRDSGFEYDIFGRLVKEIDSRNGTIQYLLNHRGERIVIINQAMKRKLISYDAFGRILQETDYSFSKVINSFTYDDVNNKLTLEHPGLKIKVETQFDVFGNKIALTDGKGQTTHFNYDEKGQLISIEAPTGSSKFYHYDNNGNLVLQQEGKQKVAFSYDSEGRLLHKITDPWGLALTTSYSYDGVGRQLEIIDANGLHKQFSYDNAGNLIQSCIDPKGLNLLSYFHYDDRGLLTEKIELNPTGKNRVTAYEWDNLGRKTAQILDPSGLKLTTRYTYDLNDNLISQTDAKNQSRFFSYDSKNRCRYQIDARGVVTEHLYDLNDNEIETRVYANRIAPPANLAEAEITALIQSSALDHYQFRDFDSIGRIVSFFNAMGYATSYEYDSNNNVISTRQYAKACALTDLKAGKRGLPDPKGERNRYFAYDGSNQLIYQVDEANYLTQFHYDDNGQVIAKTHFALTLKLKTDDYSVIQIGLAQVSSLLDQYTAYAYDRAGRLNYQANADGSVIGYTYDALGNVIQSRLFAARINTAILKSDNWTAQLDLSGQHRITRFVFDAAGREIYRISAEGRVLERRYDALGNVVAEISHSLNNDLNARETDYNYDATGRLIQKIDAHQQKTSYDYDENNNLIAKTEANSAQWIYAYDEENQLIETRSPSVKVMNSGSGWLSKTQSIVTRNVYDSFGNVIAQIRDAEGLQQTVCYVYDAKNLKTHTIYPNVSVNTATNSISAIRQEQLQNLSEELRYNAFGELIATKDRANHWRYQAYNKKGQLLYSVDAKGAVKGYRYDAFGNLLSKTVYAKYLITEQDYLYQTIARNLIKDPGDRTETYLYDLNNRLIEVRQNEVVSYNSKTRQYEKSCPTRTLTYNAFGDLTLISVKRNSTDWTKTAYYYDKDGLKTACLDAEHYLTAYSYNSFGELVDEIEYADRATSWDDEGVKAPNTSTKDRHKVYSYDKLGHLIAKTIKNVSYQRLLNHSNRYETLVGDLTTHYSYDSMGNLTTTTDPLSNISYFYYDDLNQLTTKIGPPTPAGRAVTSYNYDSLGQLVETIRHANGAKEADEDHYLLDESVNDISNRTIFDAQGKVLTTIDGLNHEIHYSYDANGQVSRSWQLLSQNNGSKRLIDKRYSYDLEGHLLQTAVFKNNGQLRTEDATYNAFGELTEKGIDGRLSIHYEYDNLGRVRRSNKSGFYQIYLYDLCSNLTQTVTSTNGFSTEYGYGGVDLSDSRFDETESFDKDQWVYNLQRQDNEYDELNRCIRQSNESALSGNEALNKVSTSQKIDRWGNILSHVSARGFETLYEYNAFDQVVKQELPSQLILDEKFSRQLINPKIYYAYDALGRAIAITDAKGHTQAKILDAEGNCFEEIDALGNGRLKTYDLFGRLQSLQNELGGLITYVYDKNNHLIKLSSPTGNQRYFYDEAGQLIQQRNALGQSQYFSYDNLDNLNQKSDTRGQFTSYAYDDAGHKIFEQNAKGHSQSWEYDDQGHLLKHKDLGDHQTFYQYNKNGLLLEESSSAGKKLSYRYLGNGQLLSYSDNTYNEVAYYSYDAEGNITSKSVGRATQSNDNGWLKEIDIYTYDAQGRLTSLRRRHPDDKDSRDPEKDQALLSIDYFYDEVGNILLTEAEANYTGYQKIQTLDYYSYDANNRMLVNKGRLVNGELSIKDQGSQLSYDAAGNVTEAYKFENGQQQQYSYRYDNHSRLNATYKNGSLLKVLTYDALSRVDKEYFYDSFGHATEIKVMTYEGDLLKYQVGYTLSFGYLSEAEKNEYSYDEVGNLTGLTSLQAKSKNISLSTHLYEYDLWDNYIQISDAATLSINGSSPTKGQNTRYLDANGQFIRSVDSQVDASGQSNNTEYKNSTIEGIHSRTDKNGQTNYLSVAGHTLGDVQLNRDGSQKLNIYGGFTPTGKFPGSKDASHSFFGREDSNQLEKMDNILINTPQDNTGTYTVHAGDSLQSIAQQVYGDASFWYLIADANGITGSANQLQNGQRLIIPAVATRQHHNADSHLVISDTELLGDLSATLPLPTALMNGASTRKTSHSLFKKITITAVSVVATVLAAAVCATLGGAIGASFSGGLGSIFSFGMKVLSGKVLGTLGSMAAGFSAGVAGNLTGQGLANLFGLQKGMNFRSALITGLSTAASTGILQELSSSPVYRDILGKLDKFSTPNLSLSSAAQMMEQDAISQGVNLALQNHQHFNWQELGIKGALAAVAGSNNAQKFRQSLTDNLGEGPGSLIESELNALATSGAQSAINGEHFNALTVLTDNLGSAIGNSFMNAEVAAEEQELINQPDPEEIPLEGSYSPIPEEENASPIPQGTYERFQLERRERELYLSIAEKANEVRSESVLGMWHTEQSDALKPERKPFQWHPVTRVSGALQAAGGGVEMLACFIPIAIPVCIHGIDNLQTGVMQGLTGKERETVTYRLLRKLSLSETNARFTDFGLSLVGAPVIAAEKYLITNSFRAVDKIYTSASNYAGKFFHAKKEQAIVSTAFLKGTLKSSEFKSQTGLALLGGLSGAFGAFASGGDAKDVMFGFAAGVGISFLGGSSNVFNNPYVSAGGSNLLGQTFSRYRDPEHNHYSLISFAFSLAGSGVANAASKAIDVKIVKAMIETLYTSSFDAVGTNLGKRKGW